MKKLLYIIFLTLTMHTSNTCYRYKNIYDNHEAIQYSYQLNKFLQECHGDVQYALLEAAARGYTYFIVPLITLGARINLQDYEGMTALMYAAEYGHVALCQQLIQRGALVNLKTHEGFTALMWAAEYGHLDTCVLLLQHGADIFAQDNLGHTAEYYAYYYGHRKVGNYLRNQAQDPLAFAITSGLMLGAVALASLFN